MNNVLMLNSPLFKEKIEASSEDYLPPIGLGYIATKLLQNGIKTQLLDCVSDNLTFNEIREKISEISPTHIGINVFSTNYTLVKELIESIEQKVELIIGGPGAKFRYKEIMNWDTDNDISIVIGEGENIVEAIINDNINESPLIDNGGKKVYVVDKKSKYFPIDISSLELDRSLFKNEPIYHSRTGEKEVNIITSRGCYHNCAFCGAARDLNKDSKVRERCIDSIKNEICNIKNLHPEVSSIRVLDDLFLKNRKSILQAIELFNSFSLKWRSMAHIKSFSGVEQDVLNSLKASGCNEIFIGIESGSEKILDFIRKGNSIENIINTIEKLFLAGINVKGYFIVGFPKETQEDIEKTYMLAKKLNGLAKKYGVTFKISVFKFRPYDGTELYSYIESRGDEIGEISHNQELSGKIGKDQFNFHSGNYSELSDQDLEKYLELINNI